MSNKKLKKYAVESFGKKPDVSYFDGDIRLIKNYYEFVNQNKNTDFLVDDITWNDLNMDEVYKMINRGLSTAGEQYLYYQLRSPAVSSDIFNERKSLIDDMDSNSSLRNKLQKYFAVLGRCRFVDIKQLFVSEKKTNLTIFKYIFMLLCFISSLILAFFNNEFFLVSIIIFAVNSTVHQKIKNKIAPDLFTINYAVNIINFFKKVKNLKDPIIDKYFFNTYDSYDRIKSVLKIKYLFNSDADALYQMICSLTFIDLIFYELIKHKIKKHSEDVFVIYEASGKLNAAIDIASFRKLINYSVPQIDFDKNTKAYISAKDIIHPLVNNCVANDLETDKSILITGSNATGKSTFLKAVFINALLAQSICTCFTSEYKSTSFKIYSSMAILDNIFAEESYYIAEIKSLKRILNSSENNDRILCAIDEVLRGTNTVERIAASSEILSSLAIKNVICLAATHDIELCHILKNKLVSYHFTEYIDNNEMKFDYKIRYGSASSRNAIRLLEIMGYDKETVHRADTLAKTYLEEGIWNQI